MKGLELGSQARRIWVRARVISGVGMPSKGRPSVEKEWAKLAIVRQVTEGRRDTMERALRGGVKGCHRGDRIPQRWEDMGGGGIHQGVKGCHYDGKACHRGGEDAIAKTFHE